ncbi:MAG: hypothetical protein JW959_03940 [Pirellulales bacterium]|nr:hypothetical protein [Pirellulales bacterium]
MDRYLLPCRCGRTVPVEPRQAGETVVCRCGARLSVPSMLEIKSLEPAPSESVAVRPAEVWGWRQLLKLLGVLLLLEAVASWALLARPTSRFQELSPEEVKRNAHQMTPAQAWDHWQWARQGLDRRTDQKYAAAVERYQIWRVVLVFIPALAGVGIIALAMMRRGP